MRIRKYGLFAAMLAAGACLLSGCGQVDDSVFESTADFSVNISVPFATTEPDEIVEEDRAQVEIDANGNVTVNDSSLLNSSYTRQTNDAEAEYETLELGDTGLAVQALQQRLQELGYFSGGISGIFDAATETAVRRFEQTYGIMQTGIATQAFQEELFSSDAPVYGTAEYESAVVSQYTTLQRGAVGSAVYALQHRLEELGYPISELTGVYDEETERAVELFYETYGLEPQPIAYIAMQQQLYSEGALRYSEGGETQTVEVDENTLTIGNVGTLVMQLQERLVELGYMTSTPSGIYDEETAAAARLFEEACGMEPTGTMSYAVQAFLLSDQAPAYGSTYAGDTTVYTDLSEGDEGDAVTALQERLIELGYASGAGDGNYGEQTTAAIRMFQRYNNLEETGVATAQVQAVLFSPTAISYDDVLNGITAQSTPAPTEAPEVLPEDELIVQTLGIGDSGSAVEELQQRLSDIGYACDVTGTYDESTASAMRAFQSAVGVSQTGEATAEMQAYIFSNAAPYNGIQMYNSTQSYITLQQGDTGEAVTRLQQRLWQLGFLLTEDVQDSIGTYHAATADAVSAAQRAMGYRETDGVAGPEFQCFLFSSYGDYLQR